VCVVCVGVCGECVWCVCCVCVCVCGVHVVCVCLCVCVVCVCGVCMCVGGGFVCVCACGYQHTTQVIHVWIRAHHNSSSPLGIRTSAEKHWQYWPEHTLQLLGLLFRIAHGIPQNHLHQLLRVWVCGWGGEGGMGGRGGEEGGGEGGLYKFAYM